MNLLLIILSFLLLIAFLFFLRREQGGRRALERKLNELNRELQTSLKHLEEEKIRLETTFSGMVEGVLLTDRKGNILHLNPTFREMFGLQGNVEGHSALEVLASVACDDALREVMRTGKVVEREILFEKPKRKVFQVHLSPLQRDGEISGVASVFHDLTAIRRLEDVRRDFIANLSHELKTPLTAIRGYAETLLDELSRGGFETRPYPPEFKKQVEIIFRNASELGHLTENLLHLSRIESGKEEVVLEKIDLRALADQIMERFKTQAAAKKIKLTNEAGAQAPPLEADPQKLNQILSNLIDNAIKYTPENGEVWVRLHLESRGGLQTRPYICIEIEDTGPGIPEADRERIFERFYRVDKARSRETGGSGLGLAIVKHLVELHGGRVEVTAGSQGGSRFRVFLPQS